MGVSAEVAKHLLGSAERRFAVDYPARRVKLADQTPEESGLSQAAPQAVELELARTVGLLERFQKLAAEDYAENRFRKKEAIIARAHPVRVIRRQAAGSDDAVDVGMMLQLLIPGVKDAEEADLGSEALGVGGNFEKRLGAATEQQVVDQFFVLQSQGRQLVGERKHDVSVGRSEQFAASRGQPAITCLALALRTVPITAGVIGDGSMAAAGALVYMASHRGGAASLDGVQDLKMQPSEPCRRPVHESVACGGYDVGQLREWPLHLLLAVAVFRAERRERQRIERAGGGFEMPSRQV